MKLSKAQKEVIRKMRNGMQVRKLDAYPYTFTICSGVEMYKILHRNTMTFLLNCGLIEQVPMNYNYIGIELTELGKTIEL